MMIHPVGSYPDRCAASGMGADIGQVDWAALHAQGLTARQASDRVGKAKTRYARAWAVAEGLEWPKTKVVLKPLPHDAIWHQMMADGATASDAAMAVFGKRQRSGDARRWAAARGLVWATARVDLAVVPPRPTYDVDMSVEAARHLWQCVLLAMWKCALDLVWDKANAFESSAARRWFGSEDFYITCMFAGFDGDVVLSRFRTARIRGRAAASPVRGLRMSHLERLTA